MTSDQLERVFGRARLKMATGEHVEVHREAAAPGERRRYTKRFLSTDDADFREWTGREWRVLARLIGHGVGCVPDVVQFDGGAAGGMRHVQTYDAGTTVDQWASLLPVRRAGLVRQHVFEDCAHWWSLAMHCLRALDEVHALGLVHLDVKADNICIPHAPASFAPDTPGMRLHVAFNRLALIDFAFSVVTGERLGTALPLGWQKDYDYQSPRLLRALEAGRQGDLAPTEALDWRCDLYSLAAMLRRYLPDDPCARGDGEQAGWTRPRYDDARALVYRLRDVHDRERPAWRPHRELIELAAGHLAAPDLVTSLTSGWELADDIDPSRGATLATPVTRIAIARAAPAVAQPSLATGTTLVVAPRTPIRARHATSTTTVEPRIQPGVEAAAATAAATSPLWTLGPARTSASPLAPPPAVLRRRPALASDARMDVPIASQRPPHRLRGVAAAVLVSAAVAAAATSIVVDDPARVMQAARDGVEQLRSIVGRGFALAQYTVASAARDARTPGTPSPTATASADAAQPDTPAGASTQPAPAAGAGTSSAGTEPARAKPEAPSAKVEVPSARPEAPSARAEAPYARMQPPSASRDAAGPAAAAPRTQAPSATPPGPVATGASVTEAAPLVAPPARVSSAASTPSRTRATPAARTDAARRTPAPATAAKPSRFASTQKPPVTVASVRGAAPLATTRVRPTEPPSAVRLASAPIDVVSVPASRDPEPKSDVRLPDSSLPSGGTVSAPSGASSARAVGADERPVPPVAAPASPPATGAAAAPTAPALASVEPPRRAATRNDPWRGLRDALAALGLRNQRPAPIEDRGAVAPVARNAPPAPVAVPIPSATQAIAPAVAAAPPAALPPAGDASVAPERPYAAPIVPAPMRGAPPGLATPRMDVAQGSTDAPRFDAFASRSADPRATPTAIESVPRVAELAHADVSQLLWSAAAFSGPIQDQAIVRASSRAWRSEQSYVRVNDAFAGSTLHARARQAFAAGQDRDARDLAMRAFAANPRDPDLAGHLAFLELRAGPENAEAARELALNALAFSGSRRSQRLDDWDTLAVASALTGRHTDAVGAFLVGLAISGSPERTCRTARHAYVTYGERLRVAVEAVQRKLLAQSGGGTACGAPTLALSRPWP